MSNWYANILNRCVGTIPLDIELCNVLKAHENTLFLQLSNILLQDKPPPSWISLELCLRKLVRVFKMVSLHHVDSIDGCHCRKFKNIVHFISKEGRNILMFGYIMCMITILWKDNDIAISWNCHRLYWYWHCKKCNMNDMSSCYARKSMSHRTVWDDLHT